MESEYVGTPFLDDCLGEKDEYRVVVRFDDQDGRSHTAEMTTCSRRGPKVGFDEYEIAYNPEDPQQIKSAAMAGFSTFMMFFSGLMVVGGIVLFVVTTFRARAGRQAQRTTM